MDLFIADKKTGPSYWKVNLSPIFSKAALSTLQMTKQMGKNNTTKKKDVKNMGSSFTTSRTRI